MILNQRRYDLVTLGEGLIEFNQTSPSAATYPQGFGGDTSNVAIAAARQGARVSTLTRLGADDFGDMLQQLWKREGIDTRFIALDEAAPTGLYFITHGPEGHRFSYRRSGSAASLMTSEMLAGGLIESAQILHVSGITQAISPSAKSLVRQAVHQAREAGTQVSYDTNYRPRLWPREEAFEALLEMLPMTDLFFPSVDDLSLLTGLKDPFAMLAWSRQHGAQKTILKRGPEGVLVDHCGGIEVISGHPVHPVDASGAGDCFVGCLLARLSLGDDLLEAARYGNAAAALSTQGFGAVGPIPHGAEVIDFLKRASHVHHD